MLVVCSTHGGVCLAVPCWSCSPARRDNIARGIPHSNPAAACVGYCVWFAGSVLSSNKTSQQVILQFPQVLPLQPLVPVLRLQFSYPLLEGLDGFYRSSYIGEGAWGKEGKGVEGLIK